MGAEDTKLHTLTTGFDKIVISSQPASLPTDFASVQREHESALANLAAGFRNSKTCDAISYGRQYPPKQLIALTF